MVSYSFVMLWIISVNFGLIYSLLLQLSCLPLALALLHFSIRELASSTMRTNMIHQRKTERLPERK